MEQARNYGQLDIQGLDQSQQALLRDYLHAHEGQEYYAKIASFMLEYLRNPDAFEPTLMAQCSAYCEFVLRRNEYKGQSLMTISPRHVHHWVTNGQMKIDWNRLKDVEVWADYHYSSTLGQRAACINIAADARNTIQDEWVRMQNGGVAFSLEDWVQKR